MIYNNDDNDDNDILPRHWFYKDFLYKRKKNILFLTRTGEVVQRHQALEHLKKDLQFTEEDNEKLKTFVMQVAGKTENKLKQESKSSVPESHDKTGNA